MDYNRDYILGKKDYILGKKDYILGKKDYILKMTSKTERIQGLHSILRM